MEGVVNMDKVFLVWERESFDEYDVILITQDEEKAKELTGEPEPCFWNTKTNYETHCWYEERETEREYDIHELL